MAAEPSSLRLDRVGVGVSVACAIHCAVLPLVPFVAAVPWARSPQSEWVFVCVAALIGVAGHGHAYVRRHRCAVPAGLFVAGLVLVLGARLAMAETSVEPYAVVSGSALLLTAHLANLRLCRRCCRSE